MRSAFRGTNWYAAGFLAVLGGALLSVGWRRWTHPIIDFGRELYVPWRLSEGEVLFRDLAYFNGPLSPYVNCVVFRVFGVSYTVLFLFNICLLIAAAWLLYRLLERQADARTATAGCALFLTTFALVDLNHFGNYNFVTPYSHEMTHGTLLSFLALLVLDGYLRERARWRSGVLGVLLGLVFLTKAEFFLAGIVAVGTILFLESLRRDARGGGRFEWVIPLVGGLLVPPIVAFLLLQTSMPWPQALRGTLGPWTYTFQPGLTDLAFYRKRMGTDFPLSNLRVMLKWAAKYALILFPAFAFAQFYKPTARDHRTTIAIATTLWTAGLFVYFIWEPGLDAAARPLPLVLLAAIATSLLSLLLSRPDAEADRQWLMRLAFEVFALVLLVKLALRPEFRNYGFALAMPASMVMVVLLLHRIPIWIDEFGGDGASFRLPALALLLVVGMTSLGLTVNAYRSTYLPFGQGADRLKVQERYELMRQLLDKLPSWVGPDETLLVLPEGIMLNFQLRLRNPTGHINFMPPELIMFGEKEILAAIEANPPDAVVVVGRDTREYGFEGIGDGYGEALMAWVVGRYRTVETMENPARMAARKRFSNASILRRVGETETLSY